MSGRYGKLTQEDAAILWRRLTQRGAANLAVLSQMSDRRDAHIMLGLAIATSAGARMWWIGREALHQMGLGPSPAGPSDARL